MEDEEYKLYSSALLSNGALLFWNVGRYPKRNPVDFYKDFVYADIAPSDYEKSHKLECVVNEAAATHQSNNEVFSRLQRDFKKYQLSPDFSGSRP